MPAASPSSPPPENTPGMSAKALTEIPRNLRMIYDRGFEALQRDNFDYAIAMFTDVLSKAPILYEVRKVLRAAQQRKSGDGGNFLSAGIRRLGSLSQVAQAQLALGRDPFEAMALVEQILNNDANNPRAHKIFAEAAMASSMPREAVMSLEILVRASPKDKELSFQLADALVQAGQKSKAEAVLAALKKHHYGDMDIESKMKDVSALKTLDEGGYERVKASGGTFIELVHDRGQARTLEQTSRQNKDSSTARSLIEDWEAQLKAEPSNVRLLRNLAETYAQQNNFEKALGYYQRIASTHGGADAALMKQISDLKLRQFDHAAANVDPLDPLFSDKVAQIKAEKRAFEIADCKQRAERYPTDLQIRFELGQKYFEAGMISEAMPEFQKAQSNPSRRLQAQTFLAKCFEKRGMNDLAARKLEEILKDKPGMDDDKKDILYTLGSLYEKMGKREQAIEHFKVIYEADIGYKDVAKKVDDYYAS